MDYSRTRCPLMSNAPHTKDRFTLDDDQLARAAEIARRAAGSAAQQTRIVGFWSAVALPFLYVPVLASGLETTTETGVVLALLVLNFLAVVVGRGHKAD